MGGAGNIRLCCAAHSSTTIAHQGDPMSDWTAGYVADIGYTYGYYTELNPLRVKLAF